jgi:2-polyprenyl-3-methyl-5-hydroxy-6-metoxy-1,4-benzoquinol methylase
MNQGTGLHDLSVEGGFPAEAFDQLAAIEPGHFWFESRNRLIVWALRTYHPLATTLLEVGCGTGFVLQGLHAAFPELQLTATDAMPGGLAIARRRVPSATLLLQDARGLNMVAGFDVVCALDVIEHIPEDVQVLGRLFTAARPGGVALITVPQHPALWSGFDDHAHHVRRYRRRELVSKMASVGFDVVRVTSFVSLLLPLLAVSRWLGAQRPGPPADREVQLSPALNAVLRAVLALERRAIAVGASWPAGGSLLAVGRKPRE